MGILSDGMKHFISFPQTYVFMDEYLYCSYRGINIKSCFMCLGNNNRRRGIGGGDAEGQASGVPQNINIHKSKTRIRWKRRHVGSKSQEEGGYMKDTFDTTSKHVNQGIKYMAHQCHEQEWNPNKLGLSRGTGGGGAEVGG